MRQDYIKTRKYMEERQENREEKAENFAVGQATEKSMLLARTGAGKLNGAGRQGLQMGREIFIRRRERREEKTVQGGGGEASKAVPGFSGRAVRSAGKRMAGRKGKSAAAEVSPPRPAKKPLQNIWRARMTAALTGRAAPSAVPTAKTAVHGVVAFAKSLAAAGKTSAAAIAAGGWAIVVIVLMVVVLGAAITFFGNQAGSHLPVSEEVEQYDPLIRKYAELHGIPEYVDLVKAVMMQESGGRGADPMQASECGFNEKYPNTPNGITDPEYSIDVGIQNLAGCLSQAGAESPVDIDNIKLALQGYNFGNGFIPWAKGSYGGYSGAAAREFSAMMAKKNGWGSYGDVDYVPHVMRYYPYSGYSPGMVFYSPGVLGLPIEGMTRADITSPFGNRASPGGIGSTNHRGTDFGFPSGTPIHACESGTVIHAGWKGGYGKCVIIDHGNGLQTLYAHQSRLNVAAGQRVIRGQCIGAVGSTGNSTGPHLHLEVRVNGVQADPMGGYLEMP